MSFRLIQNAIGLHPHLFEIQCGILSRVVAALEAGRNGFADIRQNARCTIVEKYDLKTICLPAQLALIDKVR